MNIEQIRNIKKEPDVKAFYKVVDGLKLPMHIFFPEKREGKAPAIVCIHGGSWKGISNNFEWDGGMMLPQAKYYASRGMVGVSISYRSFGGPTLYDLYSDCKDAVLYLKNNADRFGIDTEKIAVIGDSAGGHLALCLGTLETNLVNAVIACNPITDLTDKAWIKYVGDNEKAKEISPIYNIHPSNTRFLIMHGTADTCVLPRHSIDFYTKMTEAGNYCDLKLIEGAKHAFILFNYTATDEQIENAMNEADDFLCN